MMRKSDIEASIELDKFKRKRGKCATCCRCLLFVFCGLLFACQTFLLINHYFSYPTTISTKLNKSSLVGLPAVSLCFQIEDQTSRILGATELFHRNFVDGPRETVRCKLMTGPLVREKRRHGDNTLACEDVSPVVQSVNYGQAQKCYTYFSNLQNTATYTDFKEDVETMPYFPAIRQYEKNKLINSGGGDMINFEIQFPSSGQEAYHEDQEAILMIHQANELPSYSQKISRIKAGYDYTISYSKVVEKRMHPPFQPGCRSYESSRLEAGVPRSESECLDRCMLTMYREACRCLPSNMNVRRDLLYNTDQFCGDLHCNSPNIRNATICRQTSNCAPNCVEERYEFITEATPNTVQTNTYGAIYGNKIRPGFSEIASTAQTLAKAYLTIRKSASPDVVYEHQPHFEYIEFIFQVLTLACVWMGVSVFSLFWKPLSMLGNMCTGCGCGRRRRTIPLITVKE